MDNVIKFDRSKKKEEPFNPKKYVEDTVIRTALDNYKTLLNILQTNMNILSSCDVEQVWFILHNTAIDYTNKPEVVKYVCDFYRAWINELYKDLDSPVAHETYLESYLMEDLVTAMSLMEADHTTRITFWLGKQVVTIVLARTHEIWGMTNMFVDGKSIHDECFNSLQKVGFTVDYLLNWKESDQPSNGDK